MAKAIWRGCVLAESDDALLVGGTAYFPLSAVNSQLLRASHQRRFEPLRGTSRSFDLELEGQIVRNIAWWYEDAEELRHRVAFQAGVNVVFAPQ